MGSRTATLGLLAFAACFTDSPDASDSSSTSEGSTSSGAEAGESATGEASASMSTSSGDTTTSTTDPGDENSSSTGGPPITEACWSSDADWVTTMLDLGALTGELPAAPTFSPDGLALHYLAGPPGERLPYRVERDSRRDTFMGGAPVRGWNNPPMELAQLRVADVGDRLVARVGSELQVSLASAGSWQTLSPVAFEAGFEILTDPAIDGLGRVVMFARRESLRDGGGGRPALIWALYRAAWSAGDPAPSNPERLELPTFELAHAQLCPVLSPDGAHLFLGSSYPDTWDTIGADLDIFESVSQVGAWSRPTRVESLSPQDQHACPMSVTEDGCELIVRRFDVPFAGDTFMLAQRPPAGR